MGFNEDIIEEFRANRGHVATMGFGDSLIVVHSVGAKSGRPHAFPAMGLAEGDARLLIAASNAGAPDHPAWFHNLKAHPDVRIEFADPKADGGIRTDERRAELLEGAERDEAWEKFKAAAPGFAKYEVKAAPRVIPVFRLSPR